ncbi:MAG TPA: restriction endonuclease [Deltaproteobacteria bacterium]|nr:MAG: restriction endonuclease [Deltaproteobacteria bacterium GWA2_55_82]OIJ73436.1 MAG: restriction endonuclease [Deltaproteobacteria bacterium GWC2_55_46]HBG47299.1 restriction endonuclease [Deltaproteobacteria bacterium]HCY10065.1 restriction endonuclease [Deltaproteobacteria bacterium]
MAIPDFQSIMLPFLMYAGDKNEHTINEAREHLAAQFHLSEMELNELLPSGQQGVFANRVGWARSYLKKAGLIEYTKRGYCKITDRGLKVLSQNPTYINVKFLKQFPDFFESGYFAVKKIKENTDTGIETEEQTPEEIFEYSYQKIRQDLASDLLTRIKSSSPGFFERIVVELLVKMGYGGSRKDAGSAVGKSGDGGIDGIIKEDKLGLDAIYLQAKRWDSTVGRPEIQKFAGALQGFRAKKGVFITTSNFSKEAEDYASRIENKIVLIDGETLAQHMIDYDVGVSRIASYEVKKIDSDYFSEE